MALRNMAIIGASLYLPGGARSRQAIHHFALPVDSKGQCLGLPPHRNPASDTHRKLDSGRTLAPNLSIFDLGEGRLGV